MTYFIAAAAFCLLGYGVYQLMKPRPPKSYDLPVKRRGFTGD